MSGVIHVVNEFSDFLINRNEQQGDGSYSGAKFRTQFLASAESEQWWKNGKGVITLDFEGVSTIGPSWANEVFAFFTKFGVEERELLDRIRLINISPVKLALIKKEIKSGYKV